MQETVVLLNQISRVRETHRNPVGDLRWRLGRGWSPLQCREEKDSVDPSRFVFSSTTVQTFMVFLNMTPFTVALTIIIIKSCLQGTTPTKVT